MKVRASFYFTGKLSFVWFGSRHGVARNQAHRPLHHLQPQLLKVRTLPDGLHVAKAVVEDAALAVVSRPDDGEILIDALHAFAGEIDLVGVEAEQHAHVLSGEILNLINLVEECEGFRKTFHAGEL